MRKEATIGMLVLLTGCPSGPASMGQFGEEESIQCEATSRTPVLPDDSVELGYIDDLQTVTVSDLLALPAGPLTETLSWSDGTQTMVTATMANAGSPEVVTYEDVGNTEEPVAGACATLLEFTVDVALDTEDGRMADDFTGAAYSTGQVMWVEHRITAPEGTIDVEALSQEGVNVEPDEVRVGMSVAPDGTGFRGSLLPQPVGAIDDDAQPLGRWPAEEEEEE